MQSLEISGMEWPPKLYACPVTFKSTGKFDLVYYEFERFDVSNDDIEISLQASKEETEGFKTQVNLVQFDALLVWRSLF